MRILYITAGAGGMYCGSCLRDNALASELIERGHDVTLLPLYTPTLTDETNVSYGKVFFGGISVYLQQHLSLFRKSPRFLDRIWDSPLALKLASRRSIPVEPRMLGELTVSMLKGENGYQRKELKKLTDWARSESPFDIVDMQNSLFIGLAGPLKRALGRPICCTLQGEDLFLTGLLEPYRSQALDLIRSNVRDVDAFIAVSDYYADFMSGFLGIPRHKIHVVRLGINLEGHHQRQSRTESGPVIGYFARVAPEKGLHVLCAAYRSLREAGHLGGSRLEAAGYLAPEHKEYLEGIRKRMTEWGLEDEFSYQGVLDRQEKIEFLRGLDVLSVPATYDEPKGMFLLEAMANGVPVVQPRRGAFAEIIETTGGGLLVDKDDSDGLAEAILSIVTDDQLSAELSRQGYEGVRRHYTLSQMADTALRVYGAAIDAEAGGGEIAFSIRS